MHIHPEPRAEANNKVLTAYVEGGSESETPMRTAGLDGSGEVIGVSDTGLDDNSCFFKDENGMVPRYGWRCSTTKLQKGEWQPMGALE